MVQQLRRAIGDTTDGPENSGECDSRRHRSLVPSGLNSTIFRHPAVSSPATFGLWPAVRCTLSESVVTHP
jgi:hypothetical protein